MLFATVTGRAKLCLRRSLGWPLWPAGGVVLLYHRIADPATDPQRLAVSPSNFADHLAVLAERGRPLPLDELVDRARRGDVPPGAVAVTFDDGYADNLYGALPLLKQARVPATVFISTGVLRNHQEFWWDRLERLLLEPGLLPGDLRLPIGGQTMAWQLGQSAVYTEDDRERHAAWTVEERECPTGRHRAYVDLCRLLRRLPGEARDQALAALAALAGNAPGVRDGHRALVASEVATLADAQLITIGSHTESHSSLANLTSDMQLHEIAEARQQLQALTRTPVAALAYPFGGPDDVSDQTVSAARRAGVSIACTTEPGSMRPGVDPLRIPRIVVRDWSRAEFLEHWSSWTGLSA
jgi:peptidoglycan/xylan/chitin deacetylase (PgdA/CDA1 family)